MITIKEAVIVEGKYDKIKLSNFIDGLIITTDGFGVFKDKEKQQLIRHLGAGFVIRSFLKGIVPPEQVKNAYIPDIFGKEKRKASPSKEGKLGVEGLSEEILSQAIARSGATCTITDGVQKTVAAITKADLFLLGLSGCDNAAENRDKLKKRLNLPQKLTPNSLLAVLNCLMTKNELIQIMGEEEGGKQLSCGE